MRFFKKLSIIFLLLCFISPVFAETVVIGDGVQPEGITGGQTIKGGRNSGDNLVIESTANSTKGNVVIGTGATPLATFTESSPAITFRSSLSFTQEETLGVKGTTTSGLSAPNDVDVVNGYAYVISKLTPNLHIFDVSDVDSIVTKGTINTGMTDPFKISVLGKYAYIVDTTANILGIFDISDPNTPTAKATISTNLSGPSDLFVKGKYAYVVNFSINTFSLYDISDPDNIIAKDTIATGLNQPRRLYVLDRFAYITSAANNTLAIFDISDPDNVVAKGTITTGLDSPSGVYVVGRYAYVTSIGTNIFHIFDVSDPSLIVAKDTITTNVSTAKELVVAGNYAYLANEGVDAIAIFDISDANNIVAKGTTTTGLNGPTGLDLAGKYIFVPNSINNTLAIFEIENITIPALAIGTVQTDILTVANETNLNGFLNINGTLNVKNSVKFDEELTVDSDLWQVAGSFQHSVTASITASTTQTQGQQPLTSTINEVSTVANSLDTVTMPGAEVGKFVTILNNGANILQVFPATSDNLGAGVNTAISIAPGAIDHFITYDTTNWMSLSPSVGTFLGEMTIHLNVTALTISSADKVHAVRLFSTGDVANFTFDAGSTGTITNTANNGSGFLRVTDALHGLATGDIVTIVGLATAAQNDVCSVTVVDVNTFDCLAITFVTASETGSWDQGSSLTLNNTTSGLYLLEIGMSASAAVANHTFIWHPYINATQVNDIHIERKFSSIDIGRMAGSGFVTVTAGDVIWIGVENVGNTGDITHKAFNMNIHRL